MSEIQSGNYISGGDLNGQVDSQVISANNKKSWRAESDIFQSRHLGSSAADIQKMASYCGFSNLDELIDTTVPNTIRLRNGMDIPSAQSEFKTLLELKELASKNDVFQSYIGLGYHPCIVPPVIQRNIFENPGWYTQYTPYQAEIAQGRLEALLNFQTMVRDLTGLEVANASLLDEATAAAEAMVMCHHIKSSEKRNKFFVGSDCHLQTIEVVKTRAWALNIEVITGNPLDFQPDKQWSGILLQYPSTDGIIHEYSSLIGKAHQAGLLVVMAADILSLVLLKSPGELGADMAIGSTQRFGIPMGFGGPHAAYFATRDVYKRSMPGRLVGVSKDSRGYPALRLSLQTREQHIRREKATSNICTAQVLLAIMASMYAVYHGPEGLTKIASRIHGLTKLLALGLTKLGHSVISNSFFDTVRVDVEPSFTEQIEKISLQHRINLRKISSASWSITLNETTCETDVAEICQIFNGDQALPFSLDELALLVDANVDSNVARHSQFLTHPVFHRYHTETEMLRYIKRLESRDLSLTTSMIPLGSCTMKLNAAVEMYPVSWKEFADIHPFAPNSQTLGYQEMFNQLEKWLAQITGFAAVSLQPNAGSQGEYAGLLVIRKYLHSQGLNNRNVCLIPQSAHGTNPASAIMAGLKVVPVLCDQQGNIDLEDLRSKAQTYNKDLAVLMVTYPSTHGVFEVEIRQICQIIHDHGGQVYMDGANMNAQVGLCRPGDFGADVCHLNLHKTFSIPHGGGGPGMGPICVAPHLASFLPRHPLAGLHPQSSLGPISAAPYGSASILPISWSYIRLMGAEGLTRATKLAILNANYIARRLSPHFPVLYKGNTGLVAHECILDFRQFKKVTVEDVAKRLMDYGFHAPTISWPVAGTIMIEPTESESKAELDRFCDAMLSIHGEITAIETGATHALDNLLKNAPHTADQVSSDKWEHPYTRQQAAYPAAWLKDFKFWPSVSRIDNVFGDRNPICTCEGMDVIQA